jgi:hypothetical protein
MTGETPIVKIPVSNHLRELDQRLADLDRRQAELEQRWDMVLANIMAAAEKMKRQLDRSTRERAFIETTASRLLPAVFTSSEVHYTSAEAARVATANAMALYDYIDKQYRDQKGSSNGPEKNT